MPIAYSFRDTLISLLLRRGQISKTGHPTMRTSQMLPLIRHSMNAEALHEEIAVLVSDGYLELDDYRSRPGRTESYAVTLTCFTHPATALTLVKQAEADTDSPAGAEPAPQESNGTTDAEQQPTQEPTADAPQASTDAPQEYSFLG